MPCIETEMSSSIEECSPDWVVEALEESRILLLDSRSLPEYSLGHIPTAMNIFLTSLLQRRITKPNFSLCTAIQSPTMKSVFLTQHKLKTIVLYDSFSDTSSTTTSALSLIYSKLKHDGCKVVILKGGFHAFENRFPNKVTSAESTSLSSGLNDLRLNEPSTPCVNDLQFSPEFPVKVLENLYLGNAKCAMDAPLLAKYNIKYILNVTQNLPNHFDGMDSTISYKQIPIDDHWSQQLSTYFPEAFQFIDEGRSKGVGVLVHCLAGISRSVTITVAYIMSHENRSLNEAFDAVKRVKPNISPNFNFMGQLLEFEKTLQGPMECSCKLTESECTCERKMFFITPTQNKTSSILQALNTR